MTKSWKEFRFTFPPQHEEHVTALLHDEATLGSYVESQSEQALTVRAYFEISRELSSLRDRFLAAVPQLVLEEGVAVDQNWVRKWRAGLRAVPIGKRFLVVPAGVRPPKATRRWVLRLNAGMAFGTGSHQTTRLCLQALEKFYRPGARLLDVGTGSGILAIAAARLWGQRRPSRAPILGIDQDPVAVEVARRNVRLNRVAPWVRIRQGALSETAGSFDCVVANLTAPELRSNADALDRVVKRSGRIILSGILEEEEEELLRGWSGRGWKLTGAAREGGWVALVYLT
ncbi:MAG: 50S ribosomal protein L11 methyltransferase [Acidobacteria bacterium]|nr:50S ribosomal protein L11 methyltransferase [Acidobacteriota bacterium]